MPDGQTAAPAAGLRFAILPRAAEDAVPAPAPAHMQPHPLVHQELPHEPEYGLYNGRLIALAMAGIDRDTAYWMLRRQAILRHTGELALEIEGRDAVALLNRVFTRDVAKTRVGRCSYQIACTPEGGMITDGVLVRLSEDRFWYGQAEGQLLPWIKALAIGLDVGVRDPGIWISQVQGPRAMEVLEAAVDGGAPEPFRYFDAAEVTIAGQPAVITRTGFTNELGWEVYLAPDVDIQAIGARILEAGRPAGLTPIAAFGARRIEAGLLDAGTDFDQTTTPFAAGLGAMVDFEKGDFIGRDALMAAPRERRLWGLQVAGGVPARGQPVLRDGGAVGRITSGAWSPYLARGVALVMMAGGEDGPGAAVDAVCTDGVLRPGVLCDTPMYDAERLIPRGKRVDIPEGPVAGATETAAVSA